MSLRTILLGQAEETIAEKKAASTPFPKLKLPVPPSKEKQKAIEIFIDKVNEDRAKANLPPVDLD